MGFDDLAQRFEQSFGVEELVPKVIAVGVKFVPKGKPLPDGADTDDIQTPWCGAVKAAAEGDVVVITRENVGCPAAAIALGLVDPHQSAVLEGNRKYTSLMSTPASPKDFTDGFVYACKGSDRMEFALFGEADSGRYKTLGAARNAVAGMQGLNQELMDAVVAFPVGTLETEPDVVVLSLTPKQALRVVQGHCYASGERVHFDTIGIRGVCADVTADPFLNQKMNASFYCLGARALGGWEGNFLALGMPLHTFEAVVTGMEESQAGFPYKAYP